MQEVNNRQHERDYSQNFSWDSGILLGEDVKTFRYIEIVLDSATDACDEIASLDDRLLDGIHPGSQDNPTADGACNFFHGEC